MSFNVIVRNCVFIKLTVMLVFVKQMDPKIRKWFESPEKIFANFSKYLSSIEQFRESHEMANLRKAVMANSN